MPTTQPGPSTNVHWWIATSDLPTGTSEPAPVAPPTSCRNVTTARRLTIQTGIHRSPSLLRERSASVHSGLTSWIEQRPPSEGWPLSVDEIAGDLVER